MKVAHLIFSTRAAHPKSGSEFNREVIARSPGVSDAVRSAFAVRADITGSMLRQRELPAIYTFSRLGRGTWLFCRARSLGLYRKGTHQLLVHGVVLRREHLDLLDGNPFLLDHPAARERGLALADEHPAGQRELAPLALDPALAEIARQLNEERLAELGRELAAEDDAFPALFELLLRPDRHTACITTGRLDPRLIEWAILHLHPYDRAEVSFHSWYAHSRALDYRLLQATEAELPLLRQHFPDLDLWPARRQPAAESVGALARDLRRSSARRYLETLDRYRLTYHSRRGWPPLSPAEAALCLRYELGAPLEPSDEGLREVLARRSRDYLDYRVHRLAREWRQGLGGFVKDLGTREPGMPSITPQQAREVLPGLAGSGWPERWALAALLELGPRDDDPAWEATLPGVFRRLAPPERFGELLGLFTTDEQIEHAAPVLESYVERVARQEARPAAGVPEPSYWPAYLRWLAERGRPLAAPAARVERLVDAAPAGVAALWYPRLRELCFEAGLSAFAYRLLFQKEAPRLGEAEYQARVRLGVERLLDGDGSADRVLRPFLGQPRAAAAMLTAMADWLHAQQEPERAWRRWRELCARQEQTLAAGVTSAAGAFAARLAISPLAPRLGETLELLAAGDGTLRDAVVRDAALRLTAMARGAERPQVSPRLPRAVTALLAARLERPAGPRAVAEAVDEALLALLLHGLVHIDHVADRVARGTLPEAEVPDFSRALPELRGVLASYLARLLDERRFDRLAAPRDPWCHLLLDELLCEPPEDAAGDARYEGCLRLAWRRWCDDSGPELGRPSEMRIERLLGRGAVRVPAPRPWHRELARDVVDRPLYNAAERLLDRQALASEAKVP